MRDDQEVGAGLKEDKNLLKRRGEWIGFAAAQKFTELIQVRACKDTPGKRVLCRNILVFFLSDKDILLFNNGCVTSQGKTVLAWR